MTSRPASEFGRRPSRTEQGRVRRRRSDRLERTGFHRQRRRRRQGRQGAHVRARRQDRQNRVGVLSVPKTRAIRPAVRKALSPLDTSTWGNAPGFPISGGGDLDVIHARPGGRRIVRAGRQSVARLCDQRARGRRISTPTSVVVLDAMTGAYKRHFKLVPRDWHDWDVASAPALIHTAGGKTAALGRAQGWTSLRHRPRRQRPPLSHAGDQDRECRRAVCARQGGAVLPGRVRRFRVERPSLRSGHEPYHHRRGRLVHDGETADRRAAPGRADGRRLVRQRDAQPV